MPRDASAFSAQRVRTVTVRHLLPAIGVVAFSLFGLVLAETIAHHDRPHTRVRSGAFSLLIGGAWGALMLGHAAYQHRKRQRAVPELVRARIADAPAATEVAIEGRIGPVRHAAALIAPLSHAPCVYYRVRCEYRFGSGRDIGWTRLADAWKVQPFDVVDESGAVRILPFRLPREEGDEPGDELRDSVRVDLAISTRIEVHESTVGTSGLSPRVVAYLDGIKEARAHVQAGDRLRVIELALREGDLVSVSGRLNDTHTQGSAYRDGVGRSGRATADATVYPAAIADLTWLRAFHGRVVAMLITGAIVGVAAVVVGIVRGLVR